MKLTRDWLRALTHDATIPPSTKVTIIAVALESDSDGNVNVSSSRVAESLATNEVFVAECMDRASDSGWFMALRHNPTKINGVLTTPGEQPVEPPKSTTLKLKMTSPAYADKNVRTWTATDFVTFFIDKWRDEHGAEIVVSSAHKRGIIQHGVNKLSAMSGLPIHARILYRQYLVWAIPRFDKAQGAIFKDVRFMKWYLEDRSP
jgi:hypothetical protein